jgi:hypothetical protein
VTAPYRQPRRFIESSDGLRLEPVIISQLHGRFGRLPAGLATRVLKLSDPQVDKLAGAIFDFKNAADAARWLDRRSRSNGKAKA